MEQACKCAETKLGPNHVDVAKVAFRMAELCDCFRINSANCKHVVDCKQLIDCSLYYSGRAFHILNNFYKTENEEVDRARSRYINYLLLKGRYAEGCDLLKCGIKYIINQSGADCYHLVYLLSDLLQGMRSLGSEVPVEGFYTLTIGIKDNAILNDNESLFKFIARLSTECEKSQRFDLAEELLHHILGLINRHNTDIGFKSSLTECLLQLGHYYRRREQYDEAEVHYKRALENSPSIFSIMKHLAEIYELMGRAADAEKLCQKIREYENSLPHYHYGY
jgi:tetratricopeptide (TPR) repeat protein